MPRKTAQIKALGHICRPKCRRRPGTEADLPCRSENRYDAPQIQRSSGESRVNASRPPYMLKSGRRRWYPRWFSAGPVVMAGRRAFMD